MFHKFSLSLKILIIYYRSYNNKKNLLRFDHKNDNFLQLKNKNENKIKRFLSEYHVKFTIQNEKHDNSIGFFFFVIAHIWIKILCNHVDDDNNGGKKML